MSHVPDDGATPRTTAELEAELRAARQRIRELEQSAQEREELLRQDQDLSRLLRLMAHNVPDLIWAKDMDNRYLFANQAICAKLLGCDTSDEPLGRTDLFFAMRERERGHRHTFGEICVDSDHVVKDTMKPGRFLEDGLVRGKYLALDVHKAPFYDEAGKLIGTVGAGRDVTEEVRTRQALDHSQQCLEDAYARLRFLVDTSPLAMVEWDGGRVISGWSARAAELFGWQAEEVRGKGWSDFPLVHPDDHAVLQAGLLELHASGDSRSVLDVRNLTRDGRMLSCRWYNSALRDDNGQVVSILTLVQDISQQRAAEDALRASEVKYRTYVDVCPAALFVCDAENRYVDVNQAACDLLGYSREELLALGVPDLDVTADNRDDLLRHMDQARRAGSFSGERLLRAKDGRVVPVSLHAAALPEGRMLGFCLDISEAKRNREELVRREHELASILRVAPVGIGVVMDRVMVRVNEELCRITGYSREELLGQTSRMVYLSQEEYDRVGRVKYEEILRTGTGSVETTWLCKDGSTKEILLSSTPLETDDLSRGVTFTAMDITDRKHNEAALKTANQVLRSVLDSIPVNLYVADLESHRVLFMNESMQQAFGDHTGRTCYQSFRHRPSPCPNCTNPQLLQSVDEPGASLVWEAFNPVARRWYLNYDRSIRWLDGRPTRVQIGIDITERKAVEQELVRSKELAEAATRAKSDFLANMSHEIRTPLNGLLGMLQLLKATQLDPGQREYARLARQSGLRLSSLLGDILDISRIEAGRLDLHQAPFNLAEAMLSVSQLFAPTAHQKGISLRMDLDERVPQVLLGDMARLQQVLFNLVGNAVKFTENGEVRIVVSPLPPLPGEGCRVLFIVRDTGIGMSEDVLAQLFTPFTQIGRTLRRRYQGAGLGLSIVKRLVDLMGGGLSVSSESGQGTTAHLSLGFGCVEPGEVQPEEEPEATASGTAPADGRSLAGMHVLLVEDERINSLALERLLQSMGAEVQTAANGREALDALIASLDAAPFDCVLMDVQMPVMDGLEATRRIRTDPELAGVADIPVVALTAYAMAGDREAFLDADMDEYLSKPVDMDQLRQVLLGVRSGGTGRKRRTRQKQ